MMHAEYCNLEREILDCWR